MKTASSFKDKCLEYNATRTKSESFKETLNIIELDPETVDPTATDSIVHSTRCINDRVLRPFRKICLSCH